MNFSVCHLIGLRGWEWWSFGGGSCSLLILFPCTCKTEIASSGMSSSYYLAAEAGIEVSIYVFIKN